MAWTITVEVAFTTQPMSTSPSWTDITQYVKHVEGISRTFGRPDEFSDVQPGTISLTLKNADGRFTPFYTAGAYYPNVKIGKRIRVTATRSAVTYRRFDGHVNEWPVAWPSMRTSYAEVTITATDRLQRLGDDGLLRSMLEEEVLRDTPVAYYPLTEGADVAAASNIATTPQIVASVNQAGTGGTVEFAGGTGPGPDSLPAVLFTFVDRTNGKYLDAPLPTIVGTTSAVSLECWFSTEHNVGVNDVPICSLLTPNGTGSVNLLLGITEQVTWEYIQNGAVVANNAGATTGLNDGNWHHAVLTLSHNGGATVTVNLYVDGAVDYTGTFVPPHIHLQVFSHVEMGGAPLAGSFGPVTGAVYNGTLGHVAAYSAILSSSAVTRHYDAGHDGLSGETTDTRIGRIADWIGWPTADRSLDAGASTVGGQATSGRQPLEAMQEVSRTEQGVVFTDGDGKLTFHNRTRRYNTSPTITLNMAAGQVIGAFGIPGDDFGVQNDVTVSRADGGDARVINQTSIDEYGLRREQLSITTDSDAEALSLAQWRADVYGDPRTRVPSVTVDLQRLENTASSQVALLLAATIGTKIRLSNVPSQGPASTIDLFIEGLTEQFNAEHWQITFNCSPGDIPSVWQLGTVGFSELGTTTVLAY